MKLLTDATLNRDATVSRSRRLDFRMKSISSCPGIESVAVFAASLLLGAMVAALANFILLRLAVP
jgi:hypothetical protein